MTINDLKICDNCKKILEDECKKQLSAAIATATLLNIIKKMEKGN